MTSLNFPKAYPTSFSSDDVIRVSPFNTVKFRFTNFSLASDDYVYLSEQGRDNRGWGGQWGGYITPRLSGNSLPEDVTSPHHVVHVNFFSTRQDVETGWRLEWIEGKTMNLTRRCFHNKSTGGNFDGKIKYPKLVNFTNAWRFSCHILNLFIFRG